MKKRLLLIAVMAVLMTTSVFAGTDTFEFKVDGKPNSMTVFVEESGLYLPVKETLKRLDAKIDQKPYDTIDYKGVVYAPVAYFDDNLEGLLMTSKSAKSIGYASNDYLDKKNKALIESFKINHADLYKAMQKNIDASYEVEAKASAAVNIDYADPEMEEALGLDKLIASASLAGHVNFPKKEFKMNMDVDVSGGDVLNQNITGIQFILKDNVFYYFDPISERWDGEETLEKDGLSSNELLDDIALGFMSGFADKMTRTEKEDKVIYSLKLNEEALKNTINDYAGGVIYEDILDEAESSDVEFKIPSIEVEYVIKDGVIVEQNAKFGVLITMEEATFSAFVSLENNYSNHGLDKEVVLPSLYD